MRLVWISAVFVFASSGGVWAQDAALPERVMRTAHGLFDDLPEFDTAPGVFGVCGADAQVHANMAYCTSTNTILIDRSSARQERDDYELAHLLGHAVQVRHGVADVALREIRARPTEEAKLRGWVSRQVDCIAGFIHGASGAASFQLADHYEAEPFTGSHWGRNPLSKGPKASIGMAARQEWFDTGRQGDLSACAVGEFGSELLLQALKR